MRGPGDDSPPTAPHWLDRAVGAANPLQPIPSRFRSVPSRAQFLAGPLATVADKPSGPTRKDPLGPIESGGTRLDIQGLRAIAVMAVVIYHLWPTALPGGFVGVDVFFVISGFLITSHLLKSPPRKPRDFARFWARRILRLIPPVVVVVALTLICIMLFYPSAVRAKLAHESIAAMFYFENWRLIADATDYLNAAGAESPFQHFWSLSVEEQYYIVWPLIIALLVFLSVTVMKKFGRLAVVVGIAAVVISSFIVGLQMTFTSPAEAYFATYARMWELGVGSLLAALLPYLARIRTLVTLRIGLMWAGYVGIILSLFVIDGATPFPGFAAALPVLATAFVIAAEDPPGAYNPRLVLHTRGSQLLGDWSYAIYLWHWPMLVTAGYILGHEPGWVALTVLFVLSILIGWLSTRFIEQPVRTTPKLRNRTGRIFAVGAVVSSLVLVGGVVVINQAGAVITESRDAVEAQLSSDAECFGAGALDPNHNCPPNPPLVTSPEFATTDVSRAIQFEGNGCLNWPPFEGLRTCEAGAAATASAKIALIGNSHAGQFFPAFEALATQNNWYVRTYIIASCLATDEQPLLEGGFGGMTPAERTANCDDVWARAVEDIRASGFNYIVMSALDDSGSEPSVYTGFLTRLASYGLPVIVIRDAPSPGDESNPPPNCVAANIADPSVCDGPPEQWIKPDPLSTAAESLRNPMINLIGLNDLICKPDVCQMVIGGVIVYSDYNHLSATYVKTLVPYLDERIRPYIP